MIIFLVIHNSETFRLLRIGDLDSIIMSLKDTTFSKFFFTFIIMVIQNSFTIIPLIIIITINYALFGFFNGLLWSWLTSIIAAGIWFFGSRYFFNDWVQKKTNQELLSKMEQNGLLFVFQARIIPFVPTSLINILSGLSSIKFKHFLVGTMFGNLIFFFVLSLIPAGLMEGNMEQNILLGIALVLVGLVVFYRIRKKQKTRKQVN
ncbi:putative membrane protein YdjX (TVP38/TMEM64 family) [Bacillus niacini]|uniref:TVP38/TMEM64 family membrane protein n=1 Tax=Neobacillus niacini TaxID=86668 RepID=A0A852THG2_9BACI|nr:VTT domain-containing protein [Neobacillus niacini]NYE06584.1 putative membrane protein YdjX (TVP38/TMEM64 family) [Neobacillus niacini]